MKTKMGLKIVVVLAVLVAGFTFWLDGLEEEPVDVNGNDVELTEVEREFNRLPREVIIRDRRISFDRNSIDPEPREEYVELPYEVEITDEETRLIEAEFNLEPGETPIDFIERILEEKVPPQEELDAYSEDMFQYYAFFDLLDEELVAEYPAADYEDAEPAEEGLSVYVRAMNFPDDSIGGNETRYDFIVSEEGSWIMVWIGERTLCRRPDQEFWQPADQLCP